MTPYPHQADSIQHLLRRYSCGEAGLVDASDAGTGKTLVAVELCKALDLPTLVVSPLSILPGWSRMQAAQGVEISSINYDMVRTGRTDFGHWGRTSPYQKKDRFIWSPEVRLLVFDEGHRCGGRATKNSELMRAARRQRIPALVMSATLADSPLELDALGYLLGLHDGDEPPTMRNPVPLNFFRWARRNGCGPGAFTQLEFKGTPEKKRERMTKIGTQIFPDKGVRVRIADLPWFPDSDIRAELYQLGDGDTRKLQRLYDEMQKALATLEEAQKDDKDPLHPLTELLRLRQVIELLKVPLFIELAEDGIAKGMSVAIFVNFVQTLDEIMARLKSPCRIDGSQTGAGGARVREANRAAFQRDESRVIGLIAEAGSEGIDLHDIRGEFPRLTLLSPGFRAKTLIQSLHRVRRANAKTKSLQRIVLAAGTQEEKVYKTCADKWGNLSALQDHHLSI